MEITNKDVKVLGRVVSISTDNIVCDSQQVYDDEQQLFQNTINKKINDINCIDTDTIDAIIK